MAPKDIGTVNFETSCSPAVKTEFNEAVALLHSFWFAESRAIFEDVLKDDPELRDRRTGASRSRTGATRSRVSARRRRSPTARPPSTRDSPPASPTPREKGYIDAVADPVFEQRRDHAAAARARLREGDGPRCRVANKADVEARIFWALSVAQAASPTDKTLRAQSAGGRNARADVPSRCRTTPASRTTSSTPTTCRCWRRRRCRRRAPTPDIAPVGAARAPHALAHVHARRLLEGIGRQQHQVGRRCREDQRHRRSDARARLHDLRLPADGHGRAGQGEPRARDAARRRWRGGTQGAAGAGPNTFALAAIPARYAMERQQWAEAAALEPRPAPNTPYTEAITHFVRAIGAARAGQAGRRRGRHRQARRDPRSRDRDEGRVLGRARSTSSAAAPKRG